MQPADAAPSRIFLLSPANCSGLRARMVLAETAGFELARRLREPGGAPLGEIFSFVSGLYFRGKLAYARAFARPPAGLPAAGALVIAPGAGLWPAERAVTLADLRALAAVSVSAANPRHRRPLLESATALAALIDADCDVVLLGSIASDKYVEVLVSVFGERLRFPVDFVGRGDMSRGGLMLRCAAQGCELTYAPVLGAVRHGVRPPRLSPLRRGSGRPPAPATSPFAASPPTSVTRRPAVVASSDRPRGRRLSDPRESASRRRRPAGARGAAAEDGRGSARSEARRRR